jgi:hypothetical protein
MKKYLFLLACFGLLMAQCHKESASYEAVVKGRVLEVDSDVGIPNMTVKLVENDYVGTIVTPKRTTLQTVKTDAQGNYQFSYTGQRIMSYDVVAVNSSPDYNEYNQTVLIPDGGGNAVNIFLTPFGWIKVHFKNVNPFDERDEVGSAFGGFTGSKVDTTIILKIEGNRKFVRPVRIWTTRNGSQTFKDIGVITPPHDTTKLDIFY